MSTLTSSHLSVCLFVCVYVYLFVYLSFYRLNFGFCFYFNVTRRTNYLFSHFFSLISYSHSRQLFYRDCLCNFMWPSMFRILLWIWHMSLLYRSTTWNYMYSPFKPKIYGKAFKLQRRINLITFLVVLMFPPYFNIEYFIPLKLKNIIKRYIWQFVCKS